MAAASPARRWTDRRTRAGSPVQSSASETAATAARASATAPTSSRCPRAARRPPLRPRALRCRPPPIRRAPRPKPPGRRPGAPAGGAATARWADRAAANPRTATAAPPPPPRPRRRCRRRPAAPAGRSLPRPGGTIAGKLPRGDHRQPRCHRRKFAQIGRLEPAARQNGARSPIILSDHGVRRLISCSVRGHYAPSRTSATGSACGIFPTWGKGESRNRGITLPRPRAVWHNQVNFSPLMRRFHWQAPSVGRIYRRRMSPLGRFLANFIR